MIDDMMIESIVRTALFAMGVVVGIAAKICHGIFLTSNKKKESEK